ncbi:hypothetical protein [Actinoplanes sp. NPDC049681]|uniref:hypothetical protein n=1 Tax=Actinoplanes sp. NPDC049681 TaxID=3363905 RepID=UPI0037ADAD08
MTAAIMPWTRSAFRVTGRRANVVLLAFADEGALGSGPDFNLSRDAVPRDVPVAALDVRLHRYADNPAWIDSWRTGAFRHIAAGQLADLTVLDAADCCYSVAVELDDPPDLTHLQLAWAVASGLAQAGSCAVLDMYAASWWSGTEVAALEPDRPFTVQREISVIAETELVAGFGHPVHTRGMLKFGCPDLIAGVAADRIQDTSRIINHLAGMLADGHSLTPGQRLRFDHRRSLLVTDYTPDGLVPEVNLANEGLLLVDL